MTSFLRRATALVSASAVTFSQAAVLLTLLFAAGQVAEAAVRPSCNSLLATIWVNSDNNHIMNGAATDTGTVYAGTLNGTGGADVIVGTSGNDTINGGNGNDTICALGGNDIVNGDNNDDWIDGGDGNNTLNGNNHDDTIFAGTGNDIVDGGNQTDACNAGTGSNTVTNCESVAVADSDGDGVADGSDNCPLVANSDQADIDGDQIGDACDPQDNRPTSINVVKEANPSDGTDFSFTSNLPGGSSFSLDDDDGSDPTLPEARLFDLLTAGSYTITEGITAGWALNDITCTGEVSYTPDLPNRSVTVNLATGQTPSCFFTNIQTAEGSINITKEANPEDGTDFLFTSTSLGDFGLDDEGVAGPNVDSFPHNRLVGSLLPGSYTVTESALAGWTLTGITCVGISSVNYLANLETGSVTINLGAAEHADCTFTNTQDEAAADSVINIVKEANPEDGTDFGFTSTLGTFTLDDQSDDVPVDDVPHAFLPPAQQPGSYTFTEDAVAGWTLESITCTQGASYQVDLPTRSVTVTLASEDNVVCTFNNVKDDQGGGDEDDVCQDTVVSDTSNEVVETGTNAVHTFEHEAWTASIPGATWIWPYEFVQNPDQAETYTFTKDFTWNGTVSSAILDIAADNHYSVTLNGSPVGGSVDENNFQIDTQDQYDVTSLMQYGLNTLEISVTNIAFGTDAEANPAGLLYKLAIAGDCPVDQGEEDGTLTIVKQVENNNGGTKVPSDFTVAVSDYVTDIQQTAPGSASGTEFTIPAGHAFIAGEYNDPAYSMTRSVSCYGYEPNVMPAGGQVTCNLVNKDMSLEQLEGPILCEDLAEQNGWFAQYYNLPFSHPDIYQVDESSTGDNAAGRGDPLSASAPWTADWYGSTYHRFDRVESDIDFGENFYPFYAAEEETSGRYGFGVHWKGKVSSISGGVHGFTGYSDDDVWVYANNALVASNVGIHPRSNFSGTLDLTTPQVVDIFFAERQPGESAFSFQFLDEGITVMPVYDQCQSSCLVEGHKYDELGNPLEGWTIGLADSDTDLTKDLISEDATLGTDVTDADGYYCIPREVAEGPGSNYKVFEELQSGWEPHHVEVNEEPVTYFSDELYDVYINVDLPETGTLQVDFYNQETQCVEDKAEVQALENSLTGGLPLATGVTLTAGDHLVISAANDDTWSAGADDRTSNADGLGPTNPFGGNYGNYTDPVSSQSFLYGALVGQIGTGPYFLVGTNFDDNVSQSGELKLLYWDSNNADNSGSVTVSIGVNCSEEELPTLDFGDAPDTLIVSAADSLVSPPHYPTLLSHNGARHTVVEGFYLGEGIDAEFNGLQSGPADGDDTDNTDDEDGVTFLDDLIPGTTAHISVVTALPDFDTITLPEGYLVAWVDFNRDGDWDDTGERIIEDELTAGTHPLEFTVPSDASIGDTYARFRWSSVGGDVDPNLSPSGPAPDGEVEDYRLDIVADSGELLLNKSADPLSVVTGGTTTYTITVENTLATPQSFDLDDVLSAGTNDGTLTVNSGSVTATFSPAASGTFAGTYPHFLVTNLAAGATVTITYTATASDSGIGFNEDSVFFNTVTLSRDESCSTPELSIEASSSCLTAGQGVTVRGPTTGGGSSGGGGGGGGSARNPGGGGGGGNLSSDQPTGVLTADDGGEPETPLTRGFAACMMMDMLGINIDDVVLPAFVYPDVKKTHKLAKCIKAAKEHGVMIGYGDGNFRADNRISLPEALITLYRALGIPYTPGLKLPLCKDLKPYAWYLLPVREAYNSKIISISPDKKCGIDKLINRGEFNELISKFQAL